MIDETSTDTPNATYPAAASEAESIAYELHRLIVKARKADPGSPMLRVASRLMSECAELLSEYMSNYEN